MLVGVPGIEPGTSSLSGMRSNQLSYTPGTATIYGSTSRSSRRIRAKPSRPAFEAPPSTAWQPSLSASLRAKAGGGNRVRTGDPKLAKLVLYQLSYAPSPYTDRCPQTELEQPTKKHIFRSGSGAACPKAYARMNLSLAEAFATPGSYS
jgi:hypothetical protein